MGTHFRIAIEIFNVKPIANLIKDRELNTIKQCFASQFNELSHLASHVIKDDVYMLHVPHGLCYCEMLVMPLLVFS